MILRLKNRPDNTNMDDKFFEPRVIIRGAMAALFIGILYTLVFGLKEDLDWELLTVMTVAFCIGVKLAVENPPAPSPPKKNKKMR